MIVKSVRLAVLSEPIPIHGSAANAASAARPATSSTTGRMIVRSVGDVTRREQELIPGKAASVLNVAAI